MSGFVPPFFSKFGKNTKDLFKKKYEYDNTIKTINKAKGGITFETGGNVAAGFKGFVKTKYVNSDFGEVESEVYTDAKTAAKGILRLKKLAKGLNVTITEASTDPDKSFKSYVGTADVEYSQEYFAVQSVLKSDLDTTKVDLSGAVGFDGISLGGQVVVNASKGAEVVDLNVGGEYAQPDFVASVYTEKNSDVISAAYFHRVTRDTQVGALFKFELAGKQSRSLTVGGEHQLDADTSIKAKAELPSGIVSTAIEHRLSNPRLQFGVSAEFNANNQPFTAEKFGLNLTFGDY